MTKRQFQRLCAQEVPGLFSPLGFTEIEPGAYCRARPGFFHGFGFTFSRSTVRYCVPFGVTVPVIDQRGDFVMQGHYPALLVSHRLGEFRKNMRGVEKWYDCNSPEELKDSLRIVHADFLAEAEPQLAGLQTLDDVTAAYYRYRIGRPTTGEDRPPDPFAWATYGWLLQELGRQAEARSWLERAYAETTRSIYAKGGQIVPKGTKGCVLLDRSLEEKRLRALLEKELTFEH